MKDETDIKSVLFHARIKAELYSAMLAAAKLAGMNVSEFARRALEASIVKK